MPNYDPVSKKKRWADQDYYKRLDDYNKAGRKGSSGDGNNSNKGCLVYFLIGFGVTFYAVFKIMA